MWSAENTKNWGPFDAVKSRLLLFHPMNEIRVDRYFGKAVNLSLVLNLVKSAGPISRAEIATRSGLSAATVSNLSSELIDDGLVHETGVVETSRGRPPVTLSLNSKAKYVVGVKVMPGSLVAVVTDLDAQVVSYQESTELDEASFRNGKTSAAVVVGNIASLVKSVITASGVDQADLLGVGLGLAGIVDSTTGTCRYSPFFGWRDVDLASPLASLLGLDVYLENDVNSLTIAEQWFGDGRGYDSFVVVTVGSGVGAGFVLNGQFYGGDGRGVGELGHITVMPSGPTCGCGKRGCLEVMASDAALVAAAKKAVQRGELTLLDESSEVTLETVVSAATAGDEPARRLLADSGRWLGVGLAMIVNLLNPELLIVAGEGVEAGSWRLGPMQEALEENRFDSLGSGTKLVVESAGDVTWARGAACVVLSEFFKSPLHRGRPAAVPAGAGRGVHGEELP